jgi:hypothetical protein
MDNLRIFMFKKLTAAAAILTVGILALPASAASFTISEPLSTPGALDSSWVVSGRGYTPSIVTNAGDTPANALRLTDNTNGKSGFVLYNTSISTNKGIDVSFNQAQWGGTGADGIVFFVKNAANTSNVPGATGGGLGYSPSTDGGVAGLPGALLGIGLDAYGSFGNASGNGCTSSFAGTNGNGNVNAITLRGPGNGLDGYCLLADSYVLGANGKQALIDDYANRQDANRKVRVVIDAATKTDPKVTVYYQDEQIIQVALPEAFNDVSAVKIGFSAGTGGVNNNHDVWGLVSQAAEPVEEEPVDNGTPEEELAATGADSVALWYGFALALVLMALGGFAIRRSNRS